MDREDGLVGVDKVGRIEYYLAVSVLEEKFMRLVNEKLNQGWELYGSPFGSENAYCQAMIFRY